MEQITVVAEIHTNEIEKDNIETVNNAGNSDNMTEARNQKIKNKSMDSMRKASANMELKEILVISSIQNFVFHI